MGCPGNQRIAGGGVLLTQGVVSADFYSSNPPPNGGGFFLPQTQPLFPMTTQVEKAFVSMGLI